MKHFTELMGDILIVVYGAFSTWMFAMVLFTGTFFVEPNRVILVTELVLSLVIIAVGINRYFDDLKSR